MPIYRLDDNQGTHVPGMQGIPPGRFPPASLLLPGPSRLCYEGLDHQGLQHWKEWGSGLASVGWIVVQGDSGKKRGLLLLVIDTRTRVRTVREQKGLLGDLRPGDGVRAKYSMGRDALHALEGVKLAEGRRLSSTSCSPSES